MPAINTDYCYGAARRFGFCLFVYALARAVHIFAFPIRVFLITSRLRLKQPTITSWRSRQDHHGRNLARLIKDKSFRLRVGDRYGTYVPTSGTVLAGRTR